MDQLAGDTQTNLSIEEERKVARTFMGRIEWEMIVVGLGQCCLLYTSPSPRDGLLSRMPSSA